MKEIRSFCPVCGGGTVLSVSHQPKLELLHSRVAELEDALAVAQAEVAVERGRVADLMTMNVGLAAIVKDLKARLAALEDDLRQAAEVEVER